MDKFTMFGITGDKKFTLDDLFETEYSESDSFFAISKEVFHHNDDPEVSFDYHYGIEAVCTEGSTFYALMMIPTKESMKEVKMLDILDCAGIEYDECTSSDISSYGCNVIFASTGEDCEEIDMSIIDAIANTMPVIDEFFGFYMDKNQNACGETGWDWVKSWVKK